VYTGRDGSIGFSVLAASNVGLSSDWMGCCRTGSRGESERVGRGCEFNTGSSMSNDCGLAIDIDIRWCRQQCCGNVNKAWNTEDHREGRTWY